jgi:CheY-like chemotaxis protein/anti-sigma regulatory factor (Ser/Thr protein kinase)
MKHILVVDDSPADRTLAGRLLETNTDFFVEYASDGIDALERIQAGLPLAVVTDLQMPEMDGMQLVQAVRRQYPNVPVILMTGVGSEDIALEALLLGAADYVPKSHLASDLIESINSVLALAVVDRPHKRLATCLRRETLTYELENDVLLISPLVERFQQVALDLNLIDQADTIRFARSIVEALRNAIYHGNLELPFDQIRLAKRPKEAARIVAERQNDPQYRNRRVLVHGLFSRETAEITIRDEGRGFDIARLPDVETDPSHLIEREGRGLVLMKMFMDEIRIRPPGNEITLIRHKPRKAQAETN